VVEADERTEPLSQRGVADQGRSLEAGIEERQDRIGLALLAFGCDPFLPQLRGNRCGWRSST
jgi:hypothetical protein